MMPLKTKIIIAAISLIALSSIIFIIYQQHQISKRQEAIQQQMVQMKQLPDGIARAQANWATKEDLDAFAKQNNLNVQAIKDDLKNFNATLTSINISTTKSQGQVADNLASTGTASNPNSNTLTVDCNGSTVVCPDPFGYRSNRQMLQLNEKFGNISVPFGEVGFSSWQAKPWNINIAARQYQAITVLGTDENQKQYAYNKFIIKVEDKEYPIQITNNQFLQEYPSPKFSFFNPHLYLGIDPAYNINSMQGEFTPNLGIAFMSYGKFKNNVDLAVLQLGVGYGIISKKPEFLLTPITYNIGKNIPLMNNLHVGPSLQLNTSGEVSIGIGIKVGL